MSVSRVYTEVSVRTDSTTSPAAVLRVGQARDVNQSQVTVVLIRARTVLRVSMSSKTISVSECHVHHQLHLPICHAIIMIILK